MLDGLSLANKQQPAMEEIDAYPEAIRLVHPFPMGFSHMAFMDLVNQYQATVVQEFFRPGKFIKKAGIRFGQVKQAIGRLIDTDMRKCFPDELFYSWRSFGQTYVFKFEISDAF